MLQAAGNFGFLLKPAAALGMPYELGLHALYGHFAAKLHVLGEEYLAESALGVKLDNSVSALLACRARRHLRSVEKPIQESLAAVALFNVQFELAKFFGRQLFV
jgi:hypothetical protein